MNKKLFFVQFSSHGTPLRSDIRSVRKLKQVNVGGSEQVRLSPKQVDLKKLSPKQVDLDKIGFFNLLIKPIIFYAHLD